VSITNRQDADRARALRRNSEQRMEEARQMYLDRVGDINNGTPPMTYRAIAEKHGVSLRTVQNRLNAYMPDLLEGPAQYYRQVEVQKLDELEERTWDILMRNHYLVQRGSVVMMEDRETGYEYPLYDDAPKLRAINVLLNIAQRRAKLMGLDQPQQVHVMAEHIDPMDENLRAILDEARRRNDEVRRELEEGSDESS
jgi:transposase